ncbi:MAG: Mbeg1-like protein [Desulfococcaceae bacterium]
MTQPSDVAIIRTCDDEKTVSVSEIAKGNIFRRMKYIQEHAIFSANIYESDHNRLPVPDGWEKLDSLPNFETCPSGKQKIRGMEFEVWRKIHKKEELLILIVFRGTDANQLGDWCSNFRWITRFIPFVWDQYDQVRMMIPQLVDYLRHIHQPYGKETIIMCAGHSLGGGLAQQAAYASKYIKEVYAFAPSVVTGFFSVKKQVLDVSTQGMEIYRIYEKGEILSLLRWLMRKFHPLSRENPAIAEIRYNFLSGNIIYQHNMKVFAQKLKDIRMQSA